MPTRWPYVLRHSAGRQVAAWNRTRRRLGRIRGGFLDCWPSRMQFPASVTSLSSARSVIVCGPRCVSLSAILLAWTTGAHRCLAADPRVAEPLRAGPRRRCVRSTGCTPARGRTLGANRRRYAKWRTNSCISSREMSPLANAACTCCSIGMSTAAAPAQARVIHRRSRRDSPGRSQSSPKTESTKPCNRHGVIGGGASDTMNSR